MEPDDPPRKVYGFKERDFKRDNAPASDAPPPPTVKELAMMATQDGSAGGPALPKKPAGPKPGDPNDVFNALEQNRAIERKLGLDQIEIRKIKRRRMRDYLLIMIPSQALLGSITFLGRDNPVVFVSGLAGMVMLGITITWIMWQLMDRY